MHAGSRGLTLYACLHDKTHWETETSKCAVGLLSFAESSGSVSRKKCKQASKRDGYEMKLNMTGDRVCRVNLVELCTVHMPTIFACDPNFKAK